MARWDRVGGRPPAAVAPVFCHVAPRSGRLLTLSPFHCAGYAPDGSQGDRGAARGRGPHCEEKARARGAFLVSGLRNELGGDEVCASSRLQRASVAAAAGGGGRGGRGDDILHCRLTSGCPPTAWDGPVSPLPVWQGCKVNARTLTRARGSAMSGAQRKRGREIDTESGREGGEPSRCFLHSPPKPSTPRPLPRMGPSSSPRVCVCVWDRRKRKESAGIGKKKKKQEKKSKSSPRITRPSPPLPPWTPPRPPPRPPGWSKSGRPWG